MAAAVAAFRAAWRRGGGLALVIVGAAAVRLWLLAANYPLHHDEALYGYWARLIADGRDPLLLSAWVDKPPLLMYVSAIALRLGGESEQILRLPGLIASLATVLCLHGLAKQLYGHRVALLASAFLAGAPFAVLFAPTTFTDPWLTLWLVAAAWAAVAGRPFGAGIAFGLAVASKQQGVLAAPLMTALVVAGTASGGGRLSRAAGSVAAAFGRCGLALAGFALVFLPVTYWDSLRWSNRPSFWDRSLTTYGGLGLAPLALWPDRAAAWGRIVGYLFGAPAPTAAMLGLAGLAWLRDRRRFASTVIFLFCVSYLALHFCVTFQPWDRYLLPLLPFICLAAARGVEVLWRGPLRLRPADRWRPAARVGLVGGLAAIVLWGAWLGAGARLPVGSDHGAYAGLDRVAAFLAAQDADAVIYHRWLGWHFDFYLFDAPQERRWWGAGWKLADDAAQTARADPGRGQWLVLPGWRDAVAGEVRLALASRGLTLAETLRIYRGDGSRAFTVYQIVPDLALPGEAWRRG